MERLTKEEIDELLPITTRNARRARRLAARAVHRGDRKTAAGWTRAFEASEQTHTDLLELVALRASGTANARDEETLRADLRARVARFIAAAVAVQDWEDRRDAYFEAVRTGVPAEHPGPLPFTDEELVAILKA